jgi:hypothetical protein
MSFWALPTKGWEESTAGKTSPHPARQVLTPLKSHIEGCLWYFDTSAFAIAAAHFGAISALETIHQLRLVSRIH